MYKGTIQWFDYQNGYGFIENDEGGVIYLHYSAMSSHDYYRLHEGQRINFEIKQGKTSTYATNVQTIQKVITITI